MCHVRRRFASDSESKRDIDVRKAKRDIRDWYMIKTSSRTKRLRISLVREQGVGRVRGQAESRRRVRAESREQKGRGETRVNTDRILGRGRIIRMAGGPRWRWELLSLTVGLVGHLLRPWGSGGTAQAGNEILLISMSN